MITRTPVEMDDTLMQKNKGDIFKIIDSAITIAAMRWPQDFMARRDCIAQKLFNTTITSSGSDGVLSENGSAKTIESNACDGGKKKPGIIIRMKIPSANNDARIKQDAVLQTSTGTANAKGLREVEGIGKNKARNQLGVLQSSLRSTGTDNKDRDDARIKQDVLQTSTGTANEKGLREVEGIGKNKARNQLGVLQASVKSTRTDNKDRDDARIKQDVLQTSTGTANEKGLREVEGIDKNKAINQLGVLQANVKSTGTHNKDRVPEIGNRKNVQQARMTSSGTDNRKRIGQVEGLNCHLVNDVALFEQKLDAAKRKLQQRYQQFEDAKNKKKIRLIQVTDIPPPCARVEKPKMFSGANMKKPKTSFGSFRR